MERAWAAAEALLLLGAVAGGHASHAGWGWPLDALATGSRYVEGDGYGERFSKGFGDGFGHGLYGDGIDGYKLGHYGAGYGYGGNYGYGGSYKDWLDDWPGSSFEGFPSRKNTAPVKFTKGDSNFDFLEGPKYSIGFGANDHLPGDRLSHNEFGDGEKVEGTYTLKEPGGHVRTVKYFADSGGFQASVVNGGGDFDGGAAHGVGYGDGSAVLAESLKDAGLALQPAWSGWAAGGGYGLQGAYGEGPLAGGYAVQDSA